MTDRDVIVVVGAGPGIGAAVARRFAREGYAVGLVARHGDRLTRLADQLRRATDTPVATATADATDPDRLRAAVDELSGDLGRPLALCFSPIPDVGLIKPVLETDPEELMASLRLNIGGTAAAVQAVLPAMLEADRGSLLFTTGSAALNPDPARAASAVTTSATTVYIGLLREALAGTGVRVGHTVIVGPVGEEDGRHRPDAVAADLWGHHAATATGFPTVLRLR